MKKIGLIAFDLDGTILDSRKNLTERSLAALSRCAQMGIQIVPATGRAVDGIPGKILAIPGVRYAITTNGGAIVDLKTKEILKSCTLSNAKVIELIGIMKKYNAMYDPYINGRGISQPAFIEHMGNYGIEPLIQEMIRETRDIVPDTEAFVRETGSDAEKLNIFFMNLADREALREELKQVEGIIVSSSLYNNLELNAQGATKGDALLWLADYLGIDRMATMAFGDGENDVSMLKAAGIGVAMGNGGDSAKKAADEVTLSNDRDGVAAAIERLVLDLI
ncbi:MAG: Cof-type HAD-IIB family hydrolase [Clostridium sp.]|nr:Cof-type HAD-IIB family hydrolase [Clostridium sp.]